LTLFRRVEYDDEEVSQNHVADARATTNDLLDHDPDDGSEEDPT
jgi:hypothetical protein